MNLQKESLHSLSKHMALIAKTFFDFKGRKSESFLLSDSKTDDLKHRQNQFIRHVEETYEELNAIEQLFINNDFFYEDYPDWWKRLYTRSQYIHFKKRAIIHFLRIFYDED